MRKRVVVAALALVAAMVGSVAVAGSALADSHDDLTVRNAATGKCLQPKDGSYADGVPIVQVTCNGNAVQRWDFVDYDDHRFVVWNAATLKCMDAAGLNKNGTPIIQWPCGGSLTNLMFQASRDLPGYVSLKSRVSNTSTHCIDVPGGLATEGAEMRLWACNDTASQTFGAFHP